MSDLTVRDKAAQLNNLNAKDLIGKLMRKTFREGVCRLYFIQVGKGADTCVLCECSLKVKSVEEDLNNKIK